MEYRPKHLRNCSTSLIITKMQIRTSLRYHLTSLRMTKIKNTSNSLFWRGYVVWEVFLFMCCFYWLMNKEDSLACDKAE